MPSFTISLIRKLLCAPFLGGLIICSLSLCVFQCNHSPSSDNKPQKIDATAQVCFYIANSLRETVELIPTTAIDDAFFKRYGIPSRAQQRFRKMYEELRSNLLLVQKEYATRESVLYFLLNRYLLPVEKSGGTSKPDFSLAAASNPEYMAFSLLAEQMPDFNSIGSPNYIKTLARSFGVSEENVVGGIWVLLKSEPAVIYEAAARLITSNCTQAENMQPDFVFINIVTPFMTFISKDIPLDDSLATSVYKVFKATFGSNDTVNTLKDFTLAFNSYLSGNAIHVNYVNALNTTLSRYNFRMYVDSRSTIAYTILKERLPVQKDSIGNVIFLKKSNICLSMPFLGLSTAKEQDVIIPVDDVSEYASDVTYALKNGTPLFSFSFTPVGYWNSLATGFTLDSADRICATLLQQELKGESEKQIMQKLLHEISIHEVKHKWDESLKADTGWYVIDCEVSAHFAETILGPIPRYSLVSQLRRMQNFYTKTNKRSVQDKLRPLLQHLWLNAQQLSTSTITIDTFKKEATDLYTSYTSLEGGPFPPLERFDREIATPSLSSVPDFEGIIRNWKSIRNP